MTIFAQTTLTHRIRCYYCLLSQMAQKNMADVLHSPNQLCYFVIFFEFCVTYFLTYWVHNVAATVSYVRKQLLDIRKAITHHGLEINFFLEQVRQED